MFCCNHASRHSSTCLMYVLLRAVDVPNLRYVSCTICLSWENFELHWSAFLHPITYPFCLILSSCDHPLRRSVRTGRIQNYSALTWSPINVLGLSLGLALELFNKCIGRNVLYQIFLLHVSLIYEIWLSHYVDELPQTLIKVISTSVQNRRTVTNMESRTGLMQPSVLLHGR